MYPACVLTGRIHIYKLKLFLLKRIGGALKRLPLTLISGVLVLLVLVIMVPTIWALFLSFFEFSVGAARQYVGMQNYLTTFGDPNFWGALINNSIFVIAAVALELFIGLSIALLLSSGFPFQKLWFSLLIAPYAISPVVAVVSWKDMLNTTYGIINYFLSFFGIAPLNWLGSPNLAMLSIIVTEVWKYFPFTTIIAYAAIKAIPKSLFESAKIDGANGLQQLRYITLPFIKPALFVALAFRIIFVFRHFTIPRELTGGGPAGSTQILSLYLYEQGFSYWRFGRASAIAWLMLVLTVILSLYYIKRMREGIVQ